MMYQFNILPLGAVLINVPVIFLAGLLVPAGMVGMFLPGGAAPGQFIAGVWDQGVASLCGAMIRLNELCSASRITSLDVASPPIWVLGIFYLGLLVFASGKLVADGTPRTVFSDPDLLTGIGLDIPESAKLCAALREAGYDLPPDLYRPEELREHLLRLWRDAQASGKEGSPC